MVGAVDSTLVSILESRLSMQNGFDEEYLPQLMNAFLVMMIRVVTEVLPPAESAPLDKTEEEDVDTVLSKKNPANVVTCGEAKRAYQVLEEGQVIVNGSKRNHYSEPILSGIRLYVASSCALAFTREIVQKLALGPASAETFKSHHVSLDSATKTIVLW